VEYKKHLLGVKGMKRACLAILAVAFVGCATSPEITSWNMAREVNTPAAYQDYVHRYPNSGHVDEAREMVGKSKMERILKADTVDECIRIMKTNPDPKTAETVAGLAVKAAQKETSVEALYDFLAYFKGNAGAPEVRRRLEELEFKSASEDASTVAMEYFLFRYPESRFVADGRKLLSEKSYGQVKTWRNQYGFKAFVQMFPESPRAGEVRGWIRTTVPQASSMNSGGTLAHAVEKSPWLKRYGCALALSSGIRKHTGDVDSLRRDLYDLEKGANSGNLPASCSSVTVAARPGTEASIGETLRLMERAEGRRKELADQWKVYGQRDQMVRGAVGASLKVSDDLETAELSEEVLGSGPLGGLDAGREKGSVSARKALERFKAAEKMIASDREDIKRLLLETDGLYRPLQFYVTSSLAAE
jgi:hypothetical protein